MFTVDRATATLGGPGITTDGDDVTIDWDDVETVTVDNPTVNNNFGTDEFYKLSTTVARPVPQQYRVDGELKTYLKPPSELQKAAWYIDNAPWTLNHPSTGMVARTDDVRGFWRNGSYDADEDDLNADLLFPTHDDLAKAFLEENQGLSIGSYNTVIETADYDTSEELVSALAESRGDSDDYDGSLDSIGDLDDIDGLQTNLLINHISSVEQGRCSLEQGCGLNVDSAEGEWFEGTISVEPDADNEQTNMCDNPMIEVDDLTLDAIAEQNSDVAELKADAADLRSSLDEVEAERDSAVDKANALEEKNDELKSALDEYKKAEREPLADDIIEHSGRFDEDSKEDLLSRDKDALTELHDIVMDVASTEKTVEGTNDGASGGNGGSSESHEPLTATPW